MYPVLIAVKRPGGASVSPYPCQPQHTIAPTTSMAQSGPVSASKRWPGAGFE